jgi:starch phosphorylase
MPESHTHSHRTDSHEKFKKSFVDSLYYIRGSAVQSASMLDVYSALAYTVRDSVAENWHDTTQAQYKANPKFVYYLSAEYLLGQQLTQNMLYAGCADTAGQTVAEYGMVLEDIVALDKEPGLGNGGLGRLAACYLDSLATMDIPAVGYGIRYEYGIFTQTFSEGWQVEQPDDWLFYGNPWEFEQPDDMVTVHFGGYTKHYMDEQGHFRSQWVPGFDLLGEPYHMFVPGYGTRTVNLIRLWRARATKAFDFQLFDNGDYARAVAEKVRSETVTKVLYPNDNNPQGRRLRLQQQYFFVACSLKDILRRFDLRNQDLATFPEKAVIQLNDTHPVIAIVELMRILLDEYLLDWDSAWNITQHTFAYTCHTLMPEALERWPVNLFEELLPRHLELVYEINRRFLDEVRERYPGDEDRVIRMSIIQEGDERMVRMAHLATVGSFSVNGVAELQSRLLRERTLRDFAVMWPEKFSNKTNGVTPRRFIRIANPRLSGLVTSKLGGGWLRDLEQLKGLEAYVDDEAFLRQWREIKTANKKALAGIIQARTSITVDPNGLFDVMVKRLHEYKRQLLKVLHIVTLYNRLKENRETEILPRTFVFGAKAAPGYYMAKLIIKLINSVADVVNHDPDVRDRLKVVFLPNFNVTLAEDIYPAADISEQISMAGKEASGTGNMKFALNGAVTVGTLDGANIEIRARVGEENFFLFGLTTEEVFETKANGYHPRSYYETNGELSRVIDCIGSGLFSGGDSRVFQPIVSSLLDLDEYMLLADYASYIQTSEAAAAAYADQQHWTRMSLLNAARCGFFSSDRAVREYCDDIWGVTPVRVP